jgi:hypothetical protein
VHPWGLGQVEKRKKKGETQKIFEGNAITFLIPRTTLRGLFAILATRRRNVFSSLEGLLRPGALASIGLSLAKLLASASAT